MRQGLFRFAVGLPMAAMLSTVGCTGSDGKDGLTPLVTTVPAGANCTYGGASIATAAGTPVFVCDGAPGLAGAEGQSTTVVAEPKGAHCINGGAVVQGYSDAPLYICDGATGLNGADGQSAVVTVESAGTNCATGGARIQVGTGVPTYVCNGAAGTEGGAGATGESGTDGISATVTIEPKGSNCANAGIKVAVGAGTAAYVCNGVPGTNGTDGAPGAPGTDGTNGVDGLSATVVVEPSGSNCTYGGTKVQVGTGAPTFVCNGAPGAHGTNGTDGASAIVTVEPAGTHCTYGGTKVQVGTASPSYVCNGAPGSNGINGINGAGVTVTPEPASNGICGAGGIKVQVGNGAPSYVCNGGTGTSGVNGINGANSPCYSDPPLAVTSFTMAPGFVATVATSYAGARPLNYSFMGEGGYYTQIGSTNTFAFTPNVTGGPFTNYVLVSNGCQIAWGSVTDINLYAPPGDVTGATATAGSDFITVQWTNPTSANFDHVEISCTGTCTGFATTNVASPETTKTFSALTVGQVYHLKVRAMDSHGTPSAGVTVSATPTGTARLIWISSATFTGAIGGRAVADAWCQASGNAHFGTGTYIALLSDSTAPSGGQNAADRVTEFGIPYYPPNVNGNGPAAAFVALNKAALFSGAGLSAVLATTETGANSSGPQIWTGSTATGQATSLDCSGWTANACAGPGATGETGQSGNITSSWIDLASPPGCCNSFQIYCIQN